MGSGGKSLTPGEIGKGTRSHGVVTTMSKSARAVVSACSASKWSVKQTVPMLSSAGDPSTRRVAAP
jgi:hypothetical protein